MMPHSHLPDLAPRSLLYVPASNPRALAKAGGRGADMLIVDLEDAVAGGDKAAARAAAVAALAAGFGAQPVMVRVNAARHPAQADDLAALAPHRACISALVVPKVDAPADLAAPAALGLPLLAMIETPAAVLGAAAIAADSRVAGLIAGQNDLALALRLPPAPQPDPAALATALQWLVLAGRAAGKWLFDGVWNALDDPAGCEGAARAARGLGFDGKTLIHPGQIAPCHAGFAATAAELADAAALVAAAGAGGGGSGAQRFAGRMVEDMHIAAARALLARAARDLPG